MTPPEPTVYPLTLLVSQHSAYLAPASHAPTWFGPGLGCSDSHLWPLSLSPSVCRLLGIPTEPDTAVRLRITVEVIGVERAPAQPAESAEPAAAGGAA